MGPDVQNQLSDAQAITADAVSTNTIDLGNATIKRSIGDGEPMCVLISVNVAADATTGDETYVFEFIQSANANLSSPDILSSRDIPRAQLTAGSAHVIGIPPKAITKQYIGMNYNVGGTTPTITVTTFVMPQKDIDTYVNYAKGYTIS